GPTWGLFVVRCSLFVVRWKLEVGGWRLEVGGWSFLLPWGWHGRLAHVFASMANRGEPPVPLKYMSVIRFHLPRIAAEAAEVVEEFFAQGVADQGGQEE